ncbi:type VI secretion protein, partial [Burkholderia pseudomallei]
GTPPQQQHPPVGDAPAPLAAMGANTPDWPERAQWMPPRPGTVDAMAQAGTHMGWPAVGDLRFVWQAAPDPWARGACWRRGARFELSGV